MLKFNLLLFKNLIKNVEVLDLLDYILCQQS